MPNYYYILINKRKGHWIMNSPNIKPYIQQFQRTQGDQQKQETSIVVQERKSPSEQIRIENAVQDGEGNKGNRVSKERYSAARSTLPKGNFDWTEYRSFEHRTTPRKEWTWKGKLVVGIGVLLLAGVITYLIIHFFFKGNPNDMHEQSVEPVIPTFFEMSGLMNAPKLQPLVDMSGHTIPPAPKIFHLRNQ